jgi:hypothetical protein
VHLGQAAPRPENSHSDENDALFGLDTQITICTILATIINENWGQALPIIWKHPV